MLDYPEITPCNSNDARNEFSLEPCSNPGPLTEFFSCVASNETDLVSMDATGTTFEFDYEIHTYNEDWVGAAEEFQNGLAEFMAVELGVDCQVDGRWRDLGKVSSVYTEDDAIGGGGMYSPVCLGVSSGPPDSPDDFIVQCIIDPGLSQPSRCTPMNGFLTLYSRQRRHLTSLSTLETIQNYVDTRSWSPSENILAVSYIGERGVIPVGIIDPDILSRPGERLLTNKSGSVMRNADAGVGFTAMAVLGCVGAILFVVRVVRGRVRSD